MRNMKKALRIILPIILSVAVIFCACWYLLSYDREFTRDTLLTFARKSESNGNHAVATWFYNVAYVQAGNSDLVAIELAEQYRSGGNYTKAEFTLSNAIADGGGVDIYIALCKLYVEQDKLLDAVNMLNNITNPEIKAQIEAIRPAVPTPTPAPGFYSQYISVTLESEGNTIYASTNGEYPSISDPVYTEPIALGDGETTIYALSIAPNGLVSPVAIHAYTIGGVVEKMEFADAAVEAEVRSILGVNETKELFTNDLWTITSFTMPAEAKDYGDLKHMIFLEELVIENGYPDQVHNVSSLGHLVSLTITNTVVSQDDLKLIAALPSLKKLTLQHTDLSGIAPLSETTTLEVLDVSENTVISIAAVGKLTNLSELYLHSNAVSDLSPLSTCANLTRLDVSGNAITSLVPITGLTKLTWLNAGSNKVSDLGEIGNLTGLTYLNLSSNQLTDISAVAGCTQLTELDISSNQLTDISAVAGIITLMNLNFSHNEVTKLPKFTSESAIVTINGSYNKLSSISELGVLQHVNTITMSYNSEVSSVKALADCPVLMIVDVYATKVKDVDDLEVRSIKVYYTPVQ